MSEEIRRERLAFKAEAERSPWLGFAMGGEDLRLETSDGTWSWGMLCLC
jgi:hypothetical protein